MVLRCNIHSTSLKTGVIVIGHFDLVFHILTVTSLSIVLGNADVIFPADVVDVEDLFDPKQGVENSNNMEICGRVLSGCCIFGIVSNALFVALSGVLIHAVLKDAHHLLLPWLTTSLAIIITSILMLCIVGGMFYHFQHSVEASVVLTIGFLFSGFKACTWLCVLFLYRSPWKSDTENSLNEVDLTASGVNYEIMGNTPSSI